MPAAQHIQASTALTVPAPARDRRHDGVPHAQRAPIAKVHGPPAMANNVGQRACALRDGTGADYT